MESVEFGRLYERYASDVMRFALFLTGSPAEAQDITSETFVRAWVGSDRIRVGTVKAYLFMIARNLHVDWRRRQARTDVFAGDLADPWAGPESWPVYESGEASADTRTLVEEFLASDPEFARTMRSRVSGLESAVEIPPDAETIALQRTRNLVRGNAWLRGVRLTALVPTGLTFVRIMSDSRPPSFFIPHAIVSAVVWVLYALLRRWYRSRSLR